VNVVVMVNVISVQVNVVIMAMQKADVRHRLTRSGTYLQCVRWLVADHTGSAHLSVWEPLELSDGKWYRITDALPRPQDHPDLLLLQTTPGSTVKEVQQTSSLRPYGPPPPPTETVTVDILGLRLKEEFCCPLRHLLDGRPPPSQDVDCGRCNMKYSQADLKRVLSGSVRDRQSDPVLELKDVHVRSLLMEALDGGCPTIGELETALKEVRFFQVTVYQNCVVSVSRASPGTS